MSKIERILLAIDGSSTSSGAVAEALELAQHFSAGLYVVYVAQLGSKPIRENAAVLEEQKEREFLDLHAVTAQIAHQAQTLKIRCTTRTAFTEDIVDAVISAALDWACDLIVVGASAASGNLKEQIGRQITTHSRTPVLIVPQLAQLRSA